MSKILKNRFGDPLYPIGTLFDYMSYPDPYSTDPGGQIIRFKVIDHAMCLDQFHREYLAPTLDVVSKRPVSTDRYTSDMEPIFEYDEGIIEESIQFPKGVVDGNQS